MCFPLGAVAVSVGSTAILPSVALRLVQINFLVNVDLPEGTPQHMGIRQRFAELAAQVQEQRAAVKRFVAQCTLL